MLPGITACPPAFLTPSLRPRGIAAVAGAAAGFLVRHYEFSSSPFASSGAAPAARMSVMRSTVLVLTVAVLAPVILPPFLLEHDDLVGAGLVENGRGDARAVHQGGSDGRAFPVVEHQHLIQLDRGAGLAGQPLDLDHIVLADAILLPARAYDCKHRSDQSEGARPGPRFPRRRR